MNFLQMWASHDKAFDSIERVYHKRFADSKPIKRVVGLLGSDMAHVAYKKALIEILRKGYNGQGDKQLRFSLKTLMWAAVIALLPFYELSRIRRIVPKPTFPKRYHLGIRIYKDDWAFHYKQRTIDFLLDGMGLRADNTLFCRENHISREYLRELEMRGYNTVDLPNILRSTDLRFIWHSIICDLLPNCIICSILCLKHPPFVAKMTTATLHSHLLWTRFTQLYSLNHYVAYNDISKFHAMRNAVLSKNGIQTWFYQHSCHFVTPFCPPKSEVSGRSVALAYLYFDNMVCWGKRDIEEYSRHNQHIGKYHAIGSLWSEHVFG